MPKLFLLGNPRIEQDGKAIALARHKGPLLLGYLACHAGAHARDHVAAMFWPDSDLHAARLSLRVMVSELRKAMGGKVFVGGGQTLQLAPDFPLWVDVLEVQRCANSSSPTDWQAGLRLNSAEFLPAIDQEWVVAWRTQLHRLRVEALLQLSGHARTLGDYGSAVDLARQALVLDAANEGAHQQVMVCLESLGQRAAALGQFVTCSRALRREIGAEPTAATRAIAERLQVSTAIDPRRSEPVTRNMPLPFTSYVGRATELQTLCGLLRPRLAGQPPKSMVTLVGAAGCGKTRLAIQACAEASHSFDDGVCWVALGGVKGGASISQVAYEIAGVFGLKALPTEPMETTLLMSLRKKQCLLVLDNCEHLLASCTVLARMIEAWCPHVALFATSRVALGVPGETVVSVTPLPLPVRAELDLQRIAGYAAVQLFVERARAVLPAFALNQENYEAVVSICRRLDGLPFAIELAAERMKLLTPRQIDERLDDRFRLLGTGKRTTLARHKTLTALIDWSYDLLDEYERAVLRGVTVFRGGWSVAAACSVCRELKVDVEAVLESLVAKSMLMRDASGDAAYSMLETIREYAGKKLANSGEAHVAGAHHFAYVLAFVRSAVLQMRGPHQLHGATALGLPQDNIDAALVWVRVYGSAAQALSFGGALGDFWRLNQRMLDGAEGALTWENLPNARPDPGFGRAWQVGQSFALQPVLQHQPSAAA